MALAQEDLRAVLVTGASSGIGLKITETLAANGFHVYAGARKFTDLARLDAMDHVSSVRLDVTKPDDIATAVQFVRDEGRGLWGIVNNAGIVRYSSLVDGTESDMRMTLDVNVLGPYRINQAFLPLLMSGGGRTTTISSINGFVPGRNFGTYVASKFAIEGYTDSLAMDLADTGVHVSVVEPGGYKSNIRDKVLENAIIAEERRGGTLDEDTRNTLEAFAQSNDAMQEPDAVAQAVLEIMTSEAPKRRYMVTPNREQADITIRASLRRLLQLNDNQPYRYRRDDLVALLDQLLAEDE
jgi:NAD(P)-dependent dehydrogenase (short-subunit alcohol dehydrogenase family)